MEEAEWVVEVMRATGKPTAITMCIGPPGDTNNVPPGECAVRLARKGNLDCSVHRSCLFRTFSLRHRRRCLTLACVQTSSLPQENSEEETSVNRRR